MAKDHPQDGSADQSLDRARARRVEIILSELESLPTLNAITVRILELTTNFQADAHEVVRLVSADPSLSARVLALCRHHHNGRGSEVSTVERAVLLLGFEALRTAVLAVQVFDVLDEVQSPGGERGRPSPTFDREAFWLHSLAVAVVAEQVALRGSLTEDVDPGEAFTAGLLHDLGQLVLHVLLPESFDRVCQVTETHSASLDRACRQIIGIDTHTAGKKLAEHWGLPQVLTDSIWLNGQPYEALPTSCDRLMISIVTLADAMVRSRYICPGGQWARHENLAGMAARIGVNMDDLDAITAELHERVTVLGRALGLRSVSDSKVLLRAISRANKSLSRANSGMRQRELVARKQSRILEAIAAFHDAVPADATVMDVLAGIAEASPSVLGGAAIAAVYENAGEDGWNLVRLGDFGPRSIQPVEPPDEGMGLQVLLEEPTLKGSITSLVPWLVPMVDLDPDDLSIVSVGLPCERGGSTVLLVARDEEPIGDRTELHCLFRTWQAALAAAAEHEFTATVTEQLAESNRSLVEMQQTLARHQTLATLGEVAAGAAHEMNNPLTVISGRAQLLQARLSEPGLRKAATEITTQARNLSDMISALRSFAEPLALQRSATDLPDLVMRVVQEYGPGERRSPSVGTIITESIPPAWVDSALIRASLGELVRNAVESRGCQSIEIRIAIDPLGDRLRLEVRDDGAGLSPEALRHAFDPFYSDKPAGRQPGLGLARASRAVEAHGGEITLVNAAGGGAIAAIWLPDWRLPSQAPASGERRAA